MAIVGTTNKGVAMFQRHRKEIQTVLPTVILAIILIVAAHPVTGYGLAVGYFNAAGVIILISFAGVLPVKTLPPMAYAVIGFFLDLARIYLALEAIKLETKLSAPPEALQEIVGLAIIIGAVSLVADLCRGHVTREQRS